MRRFTFIGAAIVVAAAVIGVTTALTGGSTPAPAGRAAGEPLWTHGMFPAKAQAVNLTVRPAPAGSLAGADERVVSENFAVQPGVPVTVTVHNYTTAAHTFTAPGLGVSFLIRAGSARAPSKTVFTFTPAKRGVFRWYCAMPCGDVTMGGKIYAIVGRTSV